MKLEEFAKRGVAAQKAVNELGAGPKPRGQGDVLLPEKYLEVGLTPDGREVIINHPVDLETVRRGVGHIVFSPSQARHLAKLLLRKADECEAPHDR